MASTTLLPTSVSAVSGIDGATVANLTAQDGSWATAPDNNTGGTLTVDLEDPPGPPNVGSGFQSAQVQVRKSLVSGASTPTYTIEVLDSGTLIASSFDFAVNGTQVNNLTWNASALLTPDGSGVQIRVVTSPSGGKPSDRASVDVGYVAWLADYANAGLAITPAGSTHPTSSDSPGLSNVQSTVAPAEGLSLVSSDVPTVAFGTSATPEGALHPVSSGSPGLSAASAVNPASAGHPVSSDQAPVSTVAIAIDPADGTHPALAASPTLSNVKSTVAPSDGLSGSTGTDPALSNVTSAAVAPADAAHSVQSDQPTVGTTVPGTTASPADGFSGSSASSPGLSNVTSAAVAPADAGSPVASKSPTLAHRSIIAPADAFTPAASESPTIAFGTVAAPADAFHANSSGEPSLGGSGASQPSDGLHPVASGSPTLAWKATLAPAGALHGLSSGEPSLANLSVATPADSNHSITSGSPALSNVRATITPAKCFHLHWADVASIIPPSDIVTPPGRRATIAPPGLRRMWPNAIGKSGRRGAPAVGSNRATARLS